MKLKYPLPLDSQTNLVEVIDADSVPLTVVDSLRQACDNTSDMRAEREGELHTLTPFHHLQSDEIMALIVAAVVKQQTWLLHSRKPVQIEIANLEKKYQEKALSTKHFEFINKTSTISVSSTVSSTCDTIHVNMFFTDMNKDFWT